MGGQTTYDLDSASSWKVALACSWNMFWTSIVQRSGGVVFYAILKTYCTTREQATWATTLFFSVACFLGPLVGFLTMFLETRTISLVGTTIVGMSTVACVFADDAATLTVLLGVLNGVGSGFVFTANDVTICKNFQTYRATGSGINYTGGVLAAFLYPSAILYLIDYYGLRGALLISGGLCFNGLSGSLIYRTPQTSGTRSYSSRRKVVPIQQEPFKSLTDQNASATVAAISHHMTLTKNFEGDDHNTKGRNGQDGATKTVLLTHFNFLYNPVFYLIVISGIAATYVQVIYVILVDFCTDEKGFDKRRGTWLLSISAITDAGARLLSGILSDRRVLDRKMMAMLNFSSIGSVLFILPRITSYNATALLCAIFGWSNGSVVILLGPLMADYLGTKTLGISLGICRCAMGIAFFGVPALSRHFKDVAGSYTGLIDVVGGSATVVGILWIAEIVRSKMQPAV
ncbi:monocarboxylate transporter 14-like [Ornithodoros turicata]|uniref:monocarboxylate transporter 14-like n=1 Tax=Ornithodoros turicata TaxID=34597 RepID=UPI0031397574